MQQFSSWMGTLGGGMHGRLIVGDCVDAVSELDDGSVDLTLFSPPYDALRDYTGYDWHPMPLGREIYRATKEGGMCAVVIQDQTKDRAKSLTTFTLAVDWCRDIGWRLFECCIYHRHGKPGDFWRYRFRVDHEYIPLFLKGDRPKHFDKEHMMVPCKTAGQWHGRFSAHGMRTGPLGGGRALLWARRNVVAPCGPSTPAPPKATRSNWSIRPPCRTPWRGM